MPAVNIEARYTQQKRQTEAYTYSKPYVLYYPNML